MKITKLLIFLLIFTFSQNSLAGQEKFKMGWKVVSSIYKSDSDIYYTVTCYDKEGVYVDISEKFTDKGILPMNKAMTIRRGFEINLYHKNSGKIHEISMCTLAINRILVKRKSHPYEIIVNYSALFSNGTVHELVIPRMFDGG